MIAITFALPAESSRFVRRLHETRRVACSDTRLIYGRMDSRIVAVFHTGVGAEICRRRMADFLQDRQVSVLISAGFAAALTDELDAGSVLLAQNFSTVKLDRACAALLPIGPATANLATVSRILESTADRTRAAQETGAVAADMETDLIARVCAEFGVPLLALRVISDTPARPLPAPADVLFDLERQKTNLGRLMAHLITHPPTVIRLIRFTRQIRQARKTLTEALVAVATAL